MDDAADGREFAIEMEMSGEVGGWAQRAFDDFSVEIGDDKIGRLHGLVRHAAGLDGDEAGGAVDAAGVAEGVEDESAAYDFEICFKDFGT
jgi:hypothetical protein